MEDNTYKAKMNGLYKDAKMVSDFKALAVHLLAAECAGDNIAAEAFMLSGLYFVKSVFKDEGTLGAVLQLFSGYVDCGKDYEDMIYDNTRDDDSYGYYARWCFEIFRQLSGADGDKAAGICELALLEFDDREIR